MIALTQQPLAERLGLVGVVSDALDAYEDVTSLFQAFLAMADHPARREGDSLLLGDSLGDSIVIVVPAEVGAPVGDDVLEAAYSRFLSSGRARGVVVTPGAFPAADGQAWQQLDPRLAYAGLGDLQAMAEAAAAGLDPLSGWLPATGR